MAIFHDNAPGYWDVGLPVMPLRKRSKAPLLNDWSRLCRAMPTEAERTHWLETYPDHNIGLPLGPASGLCAIDIDTKDPAEEAAILGALPNSPWTRVGSKGRALIFRLPVGLRSFKIKGPNQAMIVECLGDGNQIVLPPSIHPDTGQPYAANCDLATLTRDDIPFLPIDIEERLRTALGLPSGKTKGGTRGARVVEGGRNDRLISDVGRWISQGLTEPAILKLALAQNAGFVPPLDLDEVERLVGGACRRWDDDFERNDKGKPLPSTRNIRRVLELMGITVSYNESARRMTISGLAGFGPILIDDAMRRVWLGGEEQFGLRVSKDYFFEVITDLTRQNKFHPVRDYLAGLEWDGVPRLDTWLIVYGRADDTPYVRAVARSLLLGLVKRVRQPGCKFDEMVVLEGPQGGGKSSALRILAGDERHTDNLPLTADSRLVIEQTAGKWIVEFAELQGIRNSEVEELKALLSRSVDCARAAYGRIPEEFPRQFLFVGTTNSDTYLRDSTGNRRFLPVKVSTFDLEALRRDRDQLWAEAAHREAAGESVRLDPSLWADASDAQEARRLRHPFVDILADKIGDRTGKILAADVWKLLGISPDRQAQHNAAMGDAMRELGWTRKQMRFGGPSPRWGYVKGTDQRRLEVRLHLGGEWILTDHFHQAA